MALFSSAALLQLGGRFHPSRLNPVYWNFSASYAKSAEEKLGIAKPKKPVTSYLKFVNQVRPTLLAKNPGISGIDVLKLASKHWQQLGEDVKQKLSKEYEKDYESYKKILASYNASLSEEQKEDIKRLNEEIAIAKEKKKVKLEVKELGKPKRPMTSYFLFVQSEKDSYKNLSFAEFQIKMKDKWYTLTESEKSVWEKKAEILRTDYRNELTKWEEKMIKMGHLDFVRNKSIPSTRKTKQPSA